jgi:tRNA (cytidine/uridine-2'-O-)-methyltransferase
VPDSNLRLVLLSTPAALSYVGYAFRPEDVLLFGRESAGAGRQCMRPRMRIS